MRSTCLLVKIHSKWAQKYERLFLGIFIRGLFILVPFINFQIFLFRNYYLFTNLATLLSIQCLMSMKCKFYFGKLNFDWGYFFDGNRKVWEGKIDIRGSMLMWQHWKVAKTWFYAPLKLALGAVTPLTPLAMGLHTATLFMCQYQSNSC